MNNRTKLDLIFELEGNYKNNMGVERSLDAVARYSKAIIEQSSCSKLRETLVQMVNRKSEEIAIENIHPFTQERIANEKKALQLVIKLIDEIPPVA